MPSRGGVPLIGEVVLTAVSLGPVMKMKLKDRCKLLKVPQERMSNLCSEYNFFSTLQVFLMMVLTSNA